MNRSQPQLGANSISRFTRTQQFSTRGLPLTNSIFGRKYTADTVTKESRPPIMVKNPHELKLVQQATNSYINKRQHQLHDKQYLVEKSEERSKATANDELPSAMMEGSIARPNIVKYNQVELDLDGEDFDGLSPDHRNHIKALLMTKSPQLPISKFSESLRRRIKPKRNPLYQVPKSQQQERSVSASPKKISKPTFRVNSAKKSVPSFNNLMDSVAQAINTDSLNNLVSKLSRRKQTQSTGQFEKMLRSSNTDQRGKDRMALQTLHKKNRLSLLNLTQGDSTSVGGIFVRTRDNRRREFEKLFGRRVC